MLAPLKDRTIIERENPAIPVSTAKDIEDLRRALRESRQRLRQSAWQGTRQISALHREIDQLQMRCAQYETRIERYASSQAMMDMARALMRVTEENEALRQSAQNAWQLEKNLLAAHDEYRCLRHERDMLADQLQRQAHPSAINCATQE
jgi:predicted  nucleic acid-binding Zn-ribbon protein